MPRPSRLVWTLGVLVLFAVALAGCRTAPRRFESPPGSDLLLTAELERTAEAHARFAAGFLAELNEEPAAALTNYLQSLAADPLNERLTLDVVRRLLEQRRATEAAGLLQQALGANPDSSSLRAWLGLVWGAQGRPAEAEAAFREAIRRDPAALPAYQNLVQLLAQTGRAEEAFSMLRSAAAPPELPPALLLGLAEAHAPLLSARPLDAGTVRAQLAGLVRRAVQAPGVTPPELLRAGDLLRLAGADEDALAAYQRVLEQAPDLPGLREKLVDVYLAGADRQRARTQLEALAATQPTNPLPHYYLGLLAMERDDFAAAVPHYERALLLRPQNESLHYDLALALITHDQPARALEILNRARQRFPPSFQLDYLTALAHSRAKDYPQAIRHFIAAQVAAEALEPERLTAGFHFQFGVAHERNQDLPAAAAQFEKAIALEPDFAEALNYLGYMWAERGQHLPRARALIERAVRLEPDNAAFLDSLAWVLHQQGETAAALPHMERAVRLHDGPDPILYDHLGDILHALGRIAEARAAWQKSLAAEASPAVEKKLADTAPPAAGPTP